MASLKYFLLRAVLFVVPFAVFMVLRIGVVLSAIYAVLIAFAINFLFLTRQRNAAASEVRDVFGGRKQVRSKRELADAEVEDALDDAQRAEEDAQYEDAQFEDAEDGAAGAGAVGPGRADEDVSGAKAADDPEREDRTPRDRKAQAPREEGTTS
ncbi:outer membrane murein-binding lipoprotein Lpp [Sinomonas atrocyanea]|uniref:DUF4229 domain-containing protein n=1 Tax=Sinomonas atrocyanea TaxID=37927 RepID=UPI0027848B7F|nr:DUF4229 domain-containing protein [Sinomonas atrocyanea]MDP9885565.1 outer membrane murein-binding lipoprotein Lpp [Sinomonas atrocyanea]